MSEALIWQNAIIIYQLDEVIHQLRKLNKGVRNLATSDQIAALTAEIDSLEATTDVELGQIQAKIDELTAAQGDQPDPAVDAQIARLEGLKTKIAGIIPDAPVEPV